MAKKDKITRINDAVIINKILQLRGKKVMIDRDLAELYGVSTKRLNEQVKRNLKRFPSDFMFQISEKEKEEVVANCDHLQTLRFSAGLPYVFTEHGAVMLASILNSERAIRTNIEVVRIFTQIRQSMLDTADVRLEVEKIKKELDRNNKNIEWLYLRLDKLVEQKKKPRKKVGFKIPKR